MELIKISNEIFKPGIKLCGWIRADKEDKSYLQKLGIQGEMIWVEDGNEPTTKKWEFGYKGTLECAVKTFLYDVGLLPPTETGPTNKEVHGYNGHYSFCEIVNAYTLKNIWSWPGFNPSVFTAIDENGNQLPREQQIQWRVHKNDKNKKSSGIKKLEQ